MLWKLTIYTFGLYFNKIASYYIWIKRKLLQREISQSMVLRHYSFFRSISGTKYKTYNISWQHSKLFLLFFCRVIDLLFWAFYNESLNSWNLVTDCVHESCQLFDARYGFKKRCRAWHLMIFARFTRCHTWCRFLTPCEALKSLQPSCNHSFAQLWQLRLRLL